ncbi:hypothetical protein CSB93_2105 [Pseudomonas paraeruginosa]|uniref:Uncharacterized protein n=1 Tax=Pseudomonas paraeruginosa TaxID=2994495 RepID=A0A2R3IN09_9PSED|nr:hypothetical protein CSB93_2105 [Pseudomonas paraeruginosa]AWE94526.1 hypothetical protein CSC28_0871 [Pseudomonas paraeruginosa]PTC38728.1 hypothetical protein CLJ1_0699 [Pseudomonas aeruginosa]
MISCCMPACSLCFFRYSSALSKPAIQARTLCRRQDPP